MFDEQHAQKTDKITGISKTNIAIAHISYEQMVENETNLGKISNLNSGAGRA